MNSRIFNRNDIKYKRVDKRTAARLYAAGINILICAKNENPEKTSATTILNICDEKRYKSAILSAYETKKLMRFRCAFLFLNC